MTRSWRRGGDGETGSGDDDDGVDSDDAVDVVDVVGAGCEGVTRRSTRVVADGGRVDDDGRVGAVGVDVDGDDGEAGGQGSRSDALVVAYRHDVHKLRGRRHASAADEYAGVRVNEDVPLHADRDAALLSRPRGEPEQTVANHCSPYRLSLLTGETAVTRERIKAATGGGFQALVRPTDAEELHARWVTSRVPDTFTESVYYPYTSVKFHTLLVAALLDNYRAGHGFEELFLVASDPGEDATVDGTTDASAARAAAVVEPHRTVLWTPAVALHVTGAPGDRAAARLGAVPARSFADVWARLPAHPLDVDGERRWRVLDAQLRRIRSWSAALTFIEEFVAAVGPGGNLEPRGSSGAGSAW